MNLANQLIKKRNHYISYLKGWAIISIMLIHLIDWSNLVLSKISLNFKELLYPAILFFIATAGSLTFIAYNKYDLKTASKKLFWRGGELIGVYFLYNIAKFFLYDFSREPFYWQFMAAGKFNLINLVTLKSFTAPLAIILSIGIFLLLAPILLYLAKSKFPKTAIGLLLAAVIIINYFLPLPANQLTDWLYARNNIMFPPLLWLAPFLIGFYLSMFGFDKYKGRFLLIFAGLAFLCAWPLFGHQPDLKITDNIYPLKLYYIFFSFALMFLLVYLFYFLEKIGGKIINFFLSLLRLLGDTTLAVYLYHWLAIDLTIWIFYPKVFYIWYSAPVFILAYLIIKRKNFIEYFKTY